MARTLPGAWSFRGRRAAVLGAALAYVLAAVLLYSVSDRAASLLVVLPAAAAGWLLGRQAGIVAGLLLSLVNLALFSVLAGPSWDLVLRGVPIGIALVVIGGATGWLSDLLARLQHHVQDLAAEHDQIREEVAERQRAEEALRESERRYRTLVENMSEGLLQVDNEDVILFANETFCQMVAYSRQELLGQHAAELLTVEEDRSVIKAKNALRRQRISDRYEVQVRRKSGEVIWVEISGTPVLDAKGEVVGSIGIHTDITERKRSEEARARLASILEATPDLVAAADPGGRLLSLNPAGRALLGIGEAEEIAHGNLRDVFPQWAHALVLQEGLPAALREGVWSGRAAVLHRDGREIPVSLVGLAHKTPDGSVEFLSIIARDVSASQAFEAQLSYLADHDPLTGLCNRRRFLEEVGIQLAQARRSGTSGALLFFDLDHFKTVNDRLGHGAGDALLRSLAGVLQEPLRESDVLARLGGDEFAVLLPSADAGEAVTVASRILAALRQHRVLIEGEPIGTTASIGIAVFPDHDTTAGELLAHADLAMYQAKDQGRNTARLYVAEMRSRFTWEQRMREALEKERLVLYSQPILDLRQGTTCRYEVLLRMVGEDGEIILPADFLPIAERFGLIRPIDRWVVRQAVRLIAEQGRAGQELTLEVNLSGKAFEDEELLPLIEQELATTGVHPSHLIFEVTETAVIADIGQAQRFIRTLKALGCQFAVDDFGVGFSSFYYLKHLPVDYVKIDGSFVQDLPQDPIDQHLVKAVVQVARGLGKQTVAEFAGDEQTLRLLREYGVDYAQGDFIGQPTPVSEMWKAPQVGLRDGMRRIRSRRA